MARPAWKGDPPRGSLRGADVCGAGALDRGGLNPARGTHARARSRLPGGVEDVGFLLLEVEEVIKTAYRLEVSSPGLDRKLTKGEHFQRFEGETLKVTMRFPIEGRRRFRGTLVSSDDEQIVVEVDGESHSLPLTMIDTARLVPDGA